MNFGFIYYCSNGIDSCRGCVMARSNSNFDFLDSKNEEDIVKLYADYLFKNHFEQHWGSEEYKILVNGQEYGDDDNWQEVDEIKERIINSAKKLAQEKIEGENVRRSEEFKKKKAQDEAETREWKLRQLNQLKQELNL